MSNKKKTSNTSTNPNPHVVNVFIRDEKTTSQSPSSSRFPDPHKIAEKYSLDYEEDSEEERERERGERNVSYSPEKYDEEMLMREMSEHHGGGTNGTNGTNQKMNDLILKLDSKNREIERLCVLLEAVSVVPGADPGKYIEIIDGGKEEIIDYRDSKIVSLAKKCRKLTVALNKERTISRTSSDKIQQLQDDNERLKKELNLVSSPAARAAAMRDRDTRSADHDPNSRDYKRELTQQQKQTEEWRKKYSQLQEENKKLTRSLLKEIGEGAGENGEGLEQVLEEGWRGRAQTIVMLKSKIKKLERERETGERSERKKGTRRGEDDVDKKAEDELNSMISERQQAVEALTADHARLTEACTELNQKADRYKARVRALETDASTHKQQLKVLVEKTESDDILIEALQEEIQTLRKQSDEMKKKTQQLQQTQQLNGTLRTVRGGERGELILANTSSDHLEKEIVQLKRLCKQQAAQLETQENVIQQLRSTAPKTNISSGSSSRR